MVTALSAMVWLIDVFVIAFEQDWSPVAQIKMMYQLWLHMQYLLVCLDLYMVSADNQNVEYYQKSFDT